MPPSLENDSVKVIFLCYTKSMLTTEEERARAFKVSELYSHAAQKPVVTRIEPADKFAWRGVIRPTIVLSMSFIAANFIITVFTNAGYQSEVDVAAAGMLFIFWSLAASFLAYKGCRYFYNSLFDATKYFSLMFWSSLLFLVPLFFLLRNATIDMSDQNIVSILMHLALHGLLFTAVSVGFITLIAYILERLQNSETVRFRLVVLLVSSPYLAGLAFWLVR